jgi:hypothetical protein
MGPLMVPELPRKRRWGWLLVWTLLVFAGGVAAGPILTEQAFLLVERGSSMLGMAPPQFVQKFKPAGPSIEPLPAPVVEQAPAAAARVEPAPTPAEPVAPQAVKPAESEPPARAVVQEPAVHGEPAAAAGRAQPAGSAAPVARSAHTKSEARGASHRAALSVKAPNTDTPAPAAAPFKDPFADGAPSTPKAAASGHKSSPSFDEPARPAKSEPAAKPAASSSHDSLDNLMADVVTDSKGKDKPRENKGLDALLKDVQKGKPEAPPKQEAAAPLPQLSQADISRVMAGVRTRGKECAKQLGQKGIAELNLVVGKEGRVTQVSIGGSVANTPLAACIEKAVRAASFPRSAGLRFDYRLDVRQ